MFEKGLLARHGRRSLCRALLPRLALCRCFGVSAHHGLTPPHAFPHEVAITIAARCQLLVSSLQHALLRRESLLAGSLPPSGPMARTFSADIRTLRIVRK